MSTAGRTTTTATTTETESRGGSRPAPGRTEGTLETEGAVPFDGTSFLRPGILLVYAVFVLEILFMISPFALFFYSAYGPVLNLLHRLPGTAWLTTFFLPHISTTGVLLLDRLAIVGQLLALTGLSLFLWGFVQIYLAKVRGRGAVGGGLYRSIRHPQYSALILAGAGTLLIWPRFLVLVTFVTMLFLYAWLARHEERLCRRRFGDDYRRIEERTGRFLPRGLERRLAPLGLGRLFEGRRAIAAWAVAILVSVLGAQALQRWSLDLVAAVYDGRTAILSPAPLGPETLRHAHRVASADPEVAALLRGQQPILGYVLPGSWYLADLPAEPHPSGSRGHDTPDDFDPNRLKVLYTRARTHHPDSRGREIVLRAYGREPLTLAVVDLRSDRVIEIREPTPHVLWGDIPTPLF